MMESTRRVFAKSKAAPFSNLIEAQTNSYNWFLEKGLAEIFEEISPVEDFTGQKLNLTFGEYHFEKPKYNEWYCKDNNLSYKAPLVVKLKLLNKETGEVKEQEVFLGDLPMMTDRGTFIINGIERVVVSQIVRSYGVLFVAEEAGSRRLFGAKVIPSRGAWLEVETNLKDVISVKIDRRRKVPVTTLIRAMGYGTDQEIKKLLSDVNDDPDHDYIKATLEKDPAKNHEEGVIETYRRIRPGELANYDNAKSLIDSMFFDLKRYDLGKVGRYKINRRLNLKIPNTLENRVLRREDFVEVIREVLRLNCTPGALPDDIDDLKNRRVRSVGELVQARTRVGLMRMERIIKDRMSVSDLAIVTPAMLINARPIIAVLQEFFASSQLSQFMNQTNPLAELEHKRCLSATGPGGLTRERAGFEVRDVHPSHYGRICPIETPEGPNIGLVGYLACYAKINEFGFIETPYRKVISALPKTSALLLGTIAAEEVKDGNKILVRIGREITKTLLSSIRRQKRKKTIKVKPFISGKIDYLDAAEEERAVIAPASTEVIDGKYFASSRVIVRKEGKPHIEFISKVDYIDISPKQIVSITTALIPFLEHTDAARAMMGSNMQRQAVPLVRPEAPIIGTGVERETAMYSGQIVRAQKDGTVNDVSASQITISGRGGEKVYPLMNFYRSNQATCIHQRPVVEVGDKIKEGDVIADSSSTDHGELALGKNVTVAFMSWGGGNFSDAILISEKLLHDDVYTSIHIEKYAVEVRDTKLGPEVITRDIPNVSEEALRNLDKDGIVRIGAEIKANDILVGKITPKGETELSAEERLLRAIFGEKAKDVRDSSLRLPHGERGKIVDVKFFSKAKGAELTAGVSEMIEVAIAQLRKISVGDKLAGRHGNKGVISRILPIEDMPYLPDGTPIDIILNPLGVISRMNIGQILETHIGWAAQKLGYQVATPVFEGVTIEKIKEELKRAKLPQTGKIRLYDGRTGDPFDQEVTVGSIYIMKLIHLVDDKMHARSIGPYSMVTQQPLGGKAQFGGQRFGEMEVWALEAYGAAYSLQEMLTIKSDDIIGRSKAYEAIVKGEEVGEVSTPESFNVLIKELQSLGLSVDLLKNNQKIR
jgi:DNA-directed RNA polymerase subunit beta